MVSLCGRGDGWGRGKEGAFTDAGQDDTHAGADRGILGGDGLLANGFDRAFALSADFAVFLGEHQTWINKNSESRGRTPRPHSFFIS